MQMGWMSQHKRRLEVGEGGKSHRGKQGKGKVMTREAYGGRDLEMWTQQVQLLRPLSV